MKFNLGALKLDSRSRFLLLAAFFLVIALLYYRSIYFNRATYLSDVRGRFLALKGEQARLATTLPDIKSEQGKLKSLKKNYDRIFVHLTKEERMLPKNVNIPDILKLLVKDKEEFNLKIVTISSRKDKIQEVPLYIPAPDSKQRPISYYTLLPIDIEAFASFDDTIDYIQSIEEKYPYQRISALRIDMQKSLGGQPSNLLTVLSVLGRGEEKDVGFKEFEAALASAEKSQAQEDPFRKKERPRAEERPVDLKLSGIIWKKGTPHAIINSALYKVDDVVQNKKIIKIEKDSVLLEQDDNLFKLAIGE